MKSKIIFYTIGVVVGSAATYFVMKRRMDQRIEEEVNAFKEEYSEKHDILGKIVKKEETGDGLSFTFEVNEQSGINTRTEEQAKKLADLNLQKKKDLMQARDISQRMNYNAFSKPPKEEDIDIDDDSESGIVDHPKEGLVDKPYMITPDQFVNEYPFFDKITLEYFEDGILANALSEEIIEDIDRAIGVKSLEKFGEFEEDVVFVRNEMESTDYEVIRQRRPFAKIPE